MIGNRRFAKVSARARSEASASSAALAPALEELAAAGFAMRDACVFNAALLEGSIGAKEETFGDKTGLEAYVNHIHIADYLERPADVLVQTLLYIDRIAAAWRASGAAGTLRIVVSSDGEDCTVRFHLLRLGRALLDDDLESYALEAVGYIDVCS
jgi:hypothetical protein